MCRTPTSLRRTLLVAGFLISSFASAAPVTAPHVTVDLVAESEALIANPAGSYVGIHFRPEPGWHVYWRNPGDSGLAPKVQWKADGIPGEFGPLEFPVPDRIPYGPLVNFGYDGETVILTRFRPQSGVKPGDTVEFVANARWLVCEKECVPGKAELRLKLPVAAAAVNPSPLVAKFISRLVQPLPNPSTLRVERKGSPAAFTLELKSTGIRAGEKAFFFPDESAAIAANESQKVRSSRGSIQVTAVQKEAREVEVLSGVLKIGDVGYEIRTGFDASTGIGHPLEISTTTVLGMGAIPGGVAPLPHPVPASDLPLGAAPESLFVMLLFAFVGGLILNLMPCVLPVLSIKVMGLVYQSGEGKASLRNHGLAYSGGVIVSFWVLAATLLILRAGGAFLGWGFQMQSPLFLAALSLLFFLMALNLLGVFEIGGRAIGFGSNLAAKKGYTGSFFTGVLTTVAATPCSAPFMGTALGFALTQSAATAFLVLTVLAMGLAAPYLLFSFYPGAAKVLPRPGAWMETLKQLLAFPLFATVIWLLSVIARQAGADGIILTLLMCLFSYIALWLLSRRAERTVTKIFRMGFLVLAVVLIGGIFVALKKVPPPSTSVSHLSPPWVEFSESALEAALADKKTVFVNLTAEWCVTCKVNERLVFENPAVKAAMSAAHVVSMQGDWTNGDERISRYMEKFHRNSVPVYLLYRRGSTRAEVLPQILRESQMLEDLQ